MRKILSVLVAALVAASVSSAEAQTEVKPPQGQARITIKAVGGSRMHLRVNGTHVGELNKDTPYIGTVPAGKVVVSVHQFWRLGWRHFTFTATANKSHTFYVRVETGVYRSQRHCAAVNEAVRRHKTGPWAKHDPFFWRDVARCKEQNNGTPSQITTSQ